MNLVHLKNRNEASVAEPRTGRGDEKGEFGRARCEPMEGAWVLVQVQQEAMEGRLCKECCALFGLSLSRPSEG